MGRSEGRHRTLGPLGFYNWTIYMSVGGWVVQFCFPPHPWDLAMDLTWILRSLPGLLQVVTDNFTRLCRFVHLSVITFRSVTAYRSSEEKKMTALPFLKLTNVHSSNNFKFQQIWIVSENLQQQRIYVRLVCLLDLKQLTWSQNKGKVFVDC